MTAGFFIRVNTDMLRANQRDHVLRLVIEEFNVMWDKAFGSGALQKLDAVESGDCD